MGLGLHDAALVFGLVHKLREFPFMKAAGFLLFSLTAVPCETVETAIITL